MKNSGPDKLDKAIMALNRRRARMTPEEIAASELRVNRFLTQKLPIMRYKMRCLLVAAGVPKEELDVVVAYKRSEDRVGMSRTKKFKARPATIGAGYEDPVYDDEVTEKECCRQAVLERSKPRRRQGRSQQHGLRGRPQKPSSRRRLEAVAEPALALWGQDISRAIQEELCLEPVRARRSGRRWLRRCVERLRARVSRSARKTVVGRWRRAGMAMCAAGVREWQAGAMRGGSRRSASAIKRNSTVATSRVRASCTGRSTWCAGVRPLRPVRKMAVVQHGGRLKRRQGHGRSPGSA